MYWGENKKQGFVQVFLLKESKCVEQYVFTVLEFMLLINIIVLQINPSLLPMLQRDTLFARGF